MERQGKGSLATLREVQATPYAVKSASKTKLETRAASAGGAPDPGDQVVGEGNADLQASDIEQDSHADSSIYETLDHTSQVWLSRFTHGLSPAALMGAWFDWATHITAAPGKQLHLVEKAAEKTRHQFRYALECAGKVENAKPCIEPLPQDHRFREEGGLNLVRGAQRYLQDIQNTMAGAASLGTDSFQPGQDVAVTPGKVVYHNRLIELIQYKPLTQTARPEPILIVPAWIMKYYVLDLSRQNSMVRYLVEQGHTVFVIFWKSPDAGDRGLAMDDYCRLGIMKALETIGEIVPDRKIQAVGYCLGGTLLSIEAVALARESDDRLASLTLISSQIDFTEPGELQLSINESQLAFLDSVMWRQGYLDTSQMAGAFQMLRSNDLIWSRFIHDYLMGEPTQMNDLMAWNADATRMPYKMHSEYLRKLFLNDDLAEGRFQVEGRPVHVAPWHSVFKIDKLSDADVTFVLTSGGHNAGIVSEPDHPRRIFRSKSRQAEDLHVGPEAWVRETLEQDGSWWGAWPEWLNARSVAQVTPPQMGRKGQPPVADAPGTYVFQK